jgi:hypothetical protein
VAEEEAEDGPQSTGIGFYPATEEMALASASHHEADTFLRARRALIADQRHHLHEQLRQRAAALDLTPSEKSELAGMVHG